MVKRKVVKAKSSGSINKGSKKSSAKQKKERNVIYAIPSVRECVGKNVITVELAKQLLGWEEETKENKFGTEFLCRDYYNTKIFCANNVTNRPLTPTNVASLKQEILRNRWRFNGEPLIIGKSGLVLNGQHQLIALVVATQEWKENKSQWEDFWHHEPTMEKIIVFGVSEADDTVNTMDTCKPRTLADVIYRSKYFADLATKDRSIVSRMTDYAVRFLWHRTGASENAFSIRRTHSESLNFIDHHSKIMECVKHIYEENGKSNAIGKFISPGYAAGLLYLMGCSTSSPEDYRDSPNESHLSWDMYDKASNFFVLLAAGGNELKSVSTVLAEMLSQNENVTPRERWALLIKAWKLYSHNKAVKVADIELDYDADDNGVNRLTESPIIGGIDCDGEINPTPDEIVQRSALVRGKKKSPKKLKPKSKTPRKIVLGSIVWSRVGKYKGEVVEVLGKNARVKVSTGYQGAGNILATQLADLTEK